MATTGKATIADILTPQHISSNLSLYEAARTPFFVFRFTNLTGTNSDFADKLVTSLKSMKINTLGDCRSLDAGTVIDNFELNVTASSVPHFEINELKYQRGNEVVKFAGTPNFNSGSIKVDDIVGMDTKSILMAWQNLAYDVNTRKGGRMKDYKADCQLIEYTQDFEQIRAWTLYGCWVSNLSEDSFDRGNDSGPRSIDVSISYDRAIMDIDTIVSIGSSES